ncbi:hypothetical protein SELMODRAFT_437934 [Selaginella moellendorffii]|uniref:Uncharacterized protein n=1 Tax=Selaginella moellendorffii TaxID=88036 RepID=D8QS52_SELML|nr:hypothetical protein SELMODRAFT_437934 [Selaginella moellendorffii]
MQLEGLRATEVTLCSVLAAASGANKFLDGVTYFLTVPEDYGFQRIMDHYVSVADMLARSGVLDHGLASAKNDVDCLLAEHRPLEIPSSQVCGLVRPGMPKEPGYVVHQREEHRKPLVGNPASHGGLSESVVIGRGTSSGDGHPREELLDVSRRDIDIKNTRERCSSYLGWAFLQGSCFASPPQVSKTPTTRTQGLTWLWSAKWRSSDGDFGLVFVVEWSSCLTAEEDDQTYASISDQQRLVQQEDPITPVLMRRNLLDAEEDDSKLFVPLLWLLVLQRGTPTHCSCRWGFSVIFKQEKQYMALGDRLDYLEGSSTSLLQHPSVIIQGLQVYATLTLQMNTKRFCGLRLKSEPGLHTFVRGSQAVRCRFCIPF